MLKLDNQLAVLIAVAGLVVTLTGVAFLMVAFFVPGLALVALGALGLGLGATTAQHE